MMKWVVTAVLAALVAALVLLPMRLAAGWLAPGLSADEISGSIWKARLRNAQWEQVPLGDLDVSLDWKALLAGEARLGFVRDGPRLEGEVGGSRDVRLIDGLNGELTITNLPWPIPHVDIAFDDIAVLMDVRSGCRAASGAVTARMPALPLVGATAMLSGTPGCDGAAVHIPMTEPGGRAGLDFRLWLDGRYEAGLRVVTDDRVALAGLRLAGFEPRGDAMVRAMRGNAGDLAVH